VANHQGRIVSTNPGQFYYNMIWTNNAATPEAVTINLAANNLVPMGANSVHAMTFNSGGFTQNASSFDMVNTNGVPCGPSGPCTITVAAGDTLWVTWHLQYGPIGTSANGLPDWGTVCPNPTGASACDGQSAISATGTLTNSSSTLYTCTASACGYLKH